MKKTTPEPFDPAYHRYSPRPLPAYRFIPGVTPHPRTQIPPLPALSETEGSKGGGGDFLYGVDLYNFNYWWEAHEAWETLWHQTDKTDEAGRFLQGLIQISAGMIKWWVGNQGGMGKLFREGIEKLQSLSHKKYLGIDLQDHLDKVARFLETKKTEDYPFIDLKT